MDFLEGYIICPNKVKMDILEKLNQDNNFFNYSFMTLEDLKRRLTFKVKQNAVLKLSDHFKAYALCFTLPNFQFSFFQIAHKARNCRCLY